MSHTSSMILCEEWANDERRDFHHTSMSCTTAGSIRCPRTMMVPLLLLLVSMTPGQAFTVSPSSSTPHGRRSMLWASRMPLPPPPPVVETSPLDVTSTLQEWMTKLPSTLSLRDSITRHSLDTPLTELPQSMQKWVTQASTALSNGWSPEWERSVQSLLESLQSWSSSTLSSMASILPDSVVTTVQPLIASVVATMTASVASQPTAVAVVLVALSAWVTFQLVWALLNRLGPSPTRPYPMLQYDAMAARAYFDNNLPMVVARALEIAVTSLSFGLRLLQDTWTGTVAANEEQRGRELATLLTRLGPTYIKVGQSLSIRTDLLSPAYIRGLETLQDQVPSFDTAVATDILQTEWGGRLVTDVLTAPLSATPVAAASLGQVYKGILKDTNQAVAIKVQRPDIMTKIALDMHLLREFGAWVKRVARLNTDTVGTVDVWGAGFVDELDYIQEGINGEFFSSQIKDTPLRDVVFAPRVVPDYSTRTVLVTEWVDGERLDKSNSADVSVLCSIAMNTYLTMLLELGLLHCDPHPGNLLRTPEGKLCILDFGMVTRLDKNLQLTLIEHMAHLTSADYAELPRDLLLLGFVPEDKADVIGDSGVVEVLAEIYGAWTSGGGVAAINVNKVIAQLQDLTAQKGNLFRIPPYFAYIAKSFSVLEGIGLSNDPKYSIINECLPYVSKRLLTDKDKMGPALSTFIFGPDKANADRIVDYRRVEQLVEGFGEYSTSTSGALLGKENVSRSILLEEAADQVLDLVFTEEETPLQEIVLEQMAKIISASGRTIWTELRERSGTLQSGRTRLGVLVDPLGLWRTSPLVRTNELDEKTVETTRKLIDLFQRQVQNSDNPLFNSLSREDTLQFSSILVRKVWAKRGGVVQTSNRFARMLLQLTADQLEKGERDSRRVPRRIPGTTNSSLAASSPSLETSPRLQGARRLLDEVRQQQSSAQPTMATVAVKSESDRLAGARKLLLDLQTDAGNVPL